MILRAGLLWTRNVAAAGRGYRYEGDPRHFSSHGLVALWDATVPSSVTLNATDVSGLASLVPGGDDLTQAVGANQPLYVGAPTYNGQPSIQFVRANSDGLTKTNTQVINTNPFTYYSVHRIRAIAGGAYNSILGNGEAPNGADLNLNPAAGFRDLLFVSNSEHTMGAPSTTTPEVWLISSNGPSSGVVNGYVNGVPQTMSTQAGLYTAGPNPLLYIGSNLMAATVDMDWLKGGIFTSAVPATVAVRLSKAAGAQFGFAT